ncbi:MAG: hypothetical protein M1823_001119 [Watsoniomyces obsoletus]|nr:MAG: hypothetical protein M1823_001119 [Watsoniomyces obsoletus]
MAKKGTRKAKAKAKARSSIPASNVECADSPFRIAYPNHVGSRTQSPEAVTTKLLPDEVGSSCEVQPQETWDELMGYRTVQVAGEEFHVGDFIFVNHPGVAYDGEHGNGHTTRFWIARILEIRARDSENVYIRVYWAYWPEELPGGRKAHQPMAELVLSNHMDVINAMTVAGIAKVQHWLEDDDEENPIGLFWRQNYIFQDQRLSVSHQVSMAPTRPMLNHPVLVQPIKEHCWCRGPQNPDKMLVYCNNKQCECWLHEECLVRYRLQKAYKRIEAEEMFEAVASGQRRPKRKKRSEDEPWSGMLEATLKQGASNKPLRIIIRDIRGNKSKKVKTAKMTATNALSTRSWEEPVTCLFCGETIE